MYEYPINVHQENDHFWSSCPDIPEAHSAGDTREELLHNAVDGIELALSIYVDQRRVIPMPSECAEGQEPIRLPVTACAKIVLWNTLCDRGMSKADLAAAIGLSHTVASRLVDFEHKSKIEQLEGALATLGVPFSFADPSAWIRLPHGGSEAGFYVQRVADAVAAMPGREIVLGAVNGVLSTVKPHSLDYLLRTRYAKNPDTKQVVRSLVDNMVATGLFERSTMADPETGKEVGSLRLT